MTGPVFLPGVRLCEVFYTGAVAPLLERRYPGLPHAAARIGPGYDGPRSTDHDWGPRLTLLLDAGDHARHGAGIGQYVDSTDVLSSPALRRAITAAVLDPR